MHDRVHQAEVQCQKSLEEHQRRTKEIEQQFNQRQQVLQEQLRKQMQRAIEEQARDMEEMQGEFQNATSLMNDKFNNLNHKFLELQDLYE